MKTRLSLIAAGGLFLSFPHYPTNSPVPIADAPQGFPPPPTPEQKNPPTLSFAEEEPLEWPFIPRERKGLALREMNSAQKQLANALLAAGLSQQGVVKAHTIMSLEEILKAMEQGKGPERDPEKYYFSVFGEPAETGTWAYRVE